MGANRLKQQRLAARAPEAVSAEPKQEAPGARLPQGHSCGACVPGALQEGEDGRDGEGGAAAAATAAQAGQQHPQVAAAALAATAAALRLSPDAPAAQDGAGAGGGAGRASPAPAVNDESVAGEQQQGTGAAAGPSDGLLPLCGAEAGSSSAAGVAGRTRGKGRSRGGPSSGGPVAAPQQGPPKEASEAEADPEGVRHRPPSQRLRAAASAADRADCGGGHGSADNGDGPAVPGSSHKHVPGMWSPGPWGVGVKWRGGGAGGTKSWVVCGVAVHPTACLPAALQDLPPLPPSLPAPAGSGHTGQLFQTVTMLVANSGRHIPHGLSPLRAHLPSLRARVPLVLCTHPQARMPAGAMLRRLAQCTAPGLAGP